MPAIPVMARPVLRDEMSKVLTEQRIFSRGDFTYIQTPVQPFRPTEAQIEEFAFSSAVKSQAPNENIVWFKGQYVEADNANRNGAQWRAQELAIKSLTPMLMPVTVMHDPRTAVGTIADTKLLTPEKDGVTRARIDTVLALWGHRFPEVVREAQVNAAAGTLMQSMEAYSPWYECSVCGQVFHKLPRGAEEASWCAHLKASNPSAGFVDLSQADGSQSPNASRILGDVCFTGSGLIFGTRGAEGAYTEAHLESFEDELANYHQQVHTTTPTSRSDMGLVQIEQSELDTLRKERDDARAEAVTVKTEKSEAVSAAEAAEAAKAAAETERDEAKASLKTANEEKARLQLRDERFTKLGEGFTAKLGDLTKTRLQDQAGTLSDEDWENRLKEVEELTSVKRDAAKSEDEGGEGGEGGDAAAQAAAAAAAAAAGDETFGREELARLGGVGGDNGKPETREPSGVERSNVIGSLANAFKPKEAAGASK